MDDGRNRLPAEFDRLEAPSSAYAPRQVVTYLCTREHVMSVPFAAEGIAALRRTGRMRSWASEFKQFLLRGNVIDLAVAFVIGAAFAALVQAAVTDLLTPLVAAIFGQPDFSDLTFTINGSVFRYGHFLNVLIAFVTIAFVVFFFVVKPINRLMEMSRRRESPDPSTRKCPECVSEIPIDARRCAYCTSEVAAI
ncbi:MAG TPA: large conductance mechanosensitive channel protein MscL [Actinomycetota bacterium]|nr:large conductance mechanosensitive channel protein MscL [Actinomycetota bacterium]